MYVCLPVGLSAWTPVCLIQVVVGWEGKQAQNVRLEERKTQQIRCRCSYSVTRSGLYGNMRPLPPCRLSINRLLPGEKHNVKQNNNVRFPLLFQKSTIESSSHVRPLINANMSLIQIHTAISLFSRIEPAIKPSSGRLEPSHGVYTLRSHCS